MSETKSKTIEMLKEVGFAIENTPSGDYFLNGEKITQKQVASLIASAMWAKANLVEKD